MVILAVIHNMPLQLFGASFLCVALLTPIVMFCARRYGYIAEPKQDRWHRTPTALLGGVGIFFAFATPLVLVFPGDLAVQTILVGAAFIFGIGLIDDLYHLKPYAKLFWQILVGCWVIANGLVIDLSTSPIVNIFLTIIWIVGLTNAFNLLDNMDGLAAGTGCIASLCLLFAGVLTGNDSIVLLAACLCGATLGFLLFNFHPAKIFMGDSGSLFIGYTLSTLSILGTWEHASNLIFSLVVPVLVLAVPIFDTTFVAIVRAINGRAISVGGRDHTSHRLVAFGLPERTTVLLFYLISMTCGVIALMGLRYNMLYAAVLGVMVVIAFWYFGVFLNGVVTYGERAKGIREKSRGVVLNLFLLEKKRLAEMFIDCVLIGFSYTVAFVIRFDELSSDHIRIISQSLPLLIPLKLTTFFLFGLYRGLWRYVGIQDLLNIVKAVSLGTLLGVVLFTMAVRFEGYSRAVFVIDWMILLICVGGVRVSIRLMKEYFNSWIQSEGKRLLIIGAGDAGEIALREIRNNSDFGYVPLGFIDDDPEKIGRRIHGISVLGTHESLPSLCKQLQVEEILIAIPSADSTTLKRLIRICRETGVKLQVMPKTLQLRRRGMMGSDEPVLKKEVSQEKVLEEEQIVVGMRQG